MTCSCSLDRSEERCVSRLDWWIANLCLFLASRLLRLVGPLLALKNGSDPHYTTVFRAAILAMDSLPPFTLLNPCHDPFRSDVPAVVQPSPPRAVALSRLAAPVSLTRSEHVEMKAFVTPNTWILSVMRQGCR